MAGEALEAVGARLTDGWSHGAPARDGSGAPVAIASDEAEAWSVCAAFALAAKDGIPLDRISGDLYAFGAVTGATSLEGWNDNPARTREQVLAALDAALVRVSSADG